MVSTQAAPVAIKAIYGESLHINTCGGNLSISNVSCSKNVHLASGGGDITVDSLDSGATINSEGGPVQVHLQENVGKISIMSGAGDVEIAVTPQTRVRVAVQGASQLVCSDAEVHHDKDGAFLDIDPTSSGSPTRGTNTKLPPGMSVGTVDVHTHGGKVTVRRAGWKEMVRQRLRMGLDKEQDKS
ncbi:hypothetical protein DUNSADRAFT_12356 [Dunaliella salina]|uniref:DUF4097 domain-containing protein n=1 Tax=Dunaliella salina TaxID=3046 RepID=A0ABQ7GBH1_DUNSA|nr:hypothetical protein DUNSADRAFT_12356 [Dunaliella salina]|eukprot:KAF5831961.1 hypothetical protein DUNSADRAFT_12356 [Dunaliella salina]